MLDHTVLLQKLKCTGFKESVIKWFHSYLSNRKLFVTLDVVSYAGLINCDAPQRSILGSLLFLIYINDLQQTLNQTGSYLYADDTCIFDHEKDIEKIEVLNKEFLSLCGWLIDNKLSIHLGDDKTKIFFSLKRRAQYCRRHNNSDATLIIILMHR